MFIHQDWFVELMGVLALGIESMLGLPQLIRNYQKKSTEGLRYFPSLLLFLRLLETDHLHETQ